jgi:hypothetical protein
MHMLKVLMLQLQFFSFHNVQLNQILERTCPGVELVCTVSTLQPGHLQDVRHGHRCGLLTWVNNHVIKNESCSASPAG